MKRFIIPLCLAVALLAGCTAEPESEKAENTAVAEENAQWKDSLQNTVQSLTSRVSDTLSRVNALGTPTGDEEAQRKQYSEFKKDISAVEQEIDHVEDIVESGLRESKLSQDEYQKVDRELESLDELLDSAEDHLEKTFGIHD